MQGWPGERALNGGADEIPLPHAGPGQGRLWLCGKHYIGPDPAAAVAKVGADRVVCLCERHELADRYPDYVAWLRAHADDDGTGAIWFPIHDLHAPGMEQADSFLDRVVALLVGGHTVLMHCGAGIGRAGTMAAAVLMRMGLDRSSACAAVAAARPLAGPEAGGQSDFLAELASSDRP